MQTIPLTGLAAFTSKLILGACVAAMVLASSTALAAPADHTPAVAKRPAQAKAHPCSTHGPLARAASGRGKAAAGTPAKALRVRGNGKAHKPSKHGAKKMPAPHVSPKKGLAPSTSKKLSIKDDPAAGVLTLDDVAPPARSAPSRRSHARM